MTAREIAGLGRVQWWIVAGVGAVMVIVGLLLPRMISTPAAAARSAKAEAKKPADGDYALPRMPSAPDIGSLIWRLILGTGVVLALSVATLWCGKRWFSQQPSSAAGDQRLEQVASLAIEPRCRLHLIRVGRQEVLVGTDASGVKCMVTLPEPFEEALGEVDAVVGDGLVRSDGGGI